MWGGHRFDFSGGSGIRIGRRQRGLSQEPDAGPLMVASLLNSMSISARDIAPGSGAVGAASFLLSLQAISSSTVQDIMKNEHRHRILIKTPLDQEGVFFRDSTWTMRYIVQLLMGVFCGGKPSAEK